MFTRTRMAAAATFLAGIAAAQEPTTLAPVRLGLPGFQPIAIGQMQPLPRTTNPMVQQRPAPLYYQAGAQNTPVPEPRVVPMPPDMLKLGPAPMNIPPMTPMPMVPEVPMQPITPMAPAPVPNQSFAPVPAPQTMPNVTTLPTTTLQPQAMPASPAEGIPGVPSGYHEGGHVPSGTPNVGIADDDCESGYPYRPVCFPHLHHALGYLCWTPPPAMCWVDAEYLQWWMRGTAIPTLVTRGSATDAAPGALGQPGTSTLFGGTGETNTGIQSGIRATLGGRFGSTRSGWEVRGFLMNELETRFNVASSSAYPVIARPFYDPVLNQPASLFVSLPGSFAGQVTADLKTTWWGAEANFTRNMNDPFINHLFFGFRYMELIDVLNIRTNYSVLPNGVAFINGNGVTPGSFGSIQESVRARNQFYGGQIGTRERWSVGRFTLDLRGFVAIGSGIQQVDIRGGSSIVDVNGRMVGVGGVVGQPSNIGRFDRNDLTVIPEANARLTFAFNSYLTVFAGYDFLYWANVARVGDQIDSRVDSRQIPISPLFTGAPGTNPIVGPKSTAFWAHGVSFGISLRY